MGLFKSLERKFTLGEIVHDLGLLKEEKSCGTTCRVYAMICRKDNRLQLVIKTIRRGILYLSGEGNYEFMAPDEIIRYQEMFAKARALLIGGSVRARPGTMRRFEWLRLDEMVHDFGILKEEKSGWGTVRTCAKIYRGNREHRLVLEITSSGFLFYSHSSRSVGLEEIVWYEWLLAKARALLVDVPNRRIDADRFAAGHAER